MSPVDEPFLTSAEVARLLRVHPKQVYRLLARGLPGHRVGGEWRFSRSEVVAWSGGKVAARATEGNIPPLLAANGDLVIELLIERLVIESKPLAGLVIADSATAIRELEARRVLAAGFHGETPPSHVGTERLARIHLVEREVGLAFPRGARMRKVTDIAKKRIATRAPTAGVRKHFDRALAAAKTSVTALRAKPTVQDSHRDAVCAVLRGEADVALATSAWAERVGLGFLPLAVEPYDLLVHAENLGLPVCVAICEVAQTRGFRSSLAKLAGYAPRASGEIRYERAD